MMIIIFIVGSVGFLTWAILTLISRHRLLVKLRALKNLQAYKDDFKAQASLMFKYNVTAYGAHMLQELERTHGINILDCLSVKNHYKRENRFPLWFGMKYNTKLSYIKPMMPWL